MDTIIQTIITVVCSVLASSGLWAFISSRANRKDATIAMLRGLAHDRIVYLGMKYIERGWIYRTEYENLYECLYIPYKNLGGNGSAKRVMDEVNKLPIHAATYRLEQIEARGENDVAK